MTNWLMRYLKAGRNQLSFLPVQYPLNRWAEGRAAQCFPQALTAPPPIRILSTDNHCVYLCRNGKTFLVFDQELEETLSELDFAVAADIPDTILYIRPLMLLADSFCCTAITDWVCNVLLKNGI